MQWKMALEDWLEQEREAQSQLLETKFQREEEQSTFIQQKHIGHSRSEMVLPVSLSHQKHQRARWPIGGTKEVRETVDLIDEATHALEGKVASLRDLRYERLLPLTMHQRRRFEKIRQEVDQNRDHLFSSLKPCEIVKHKVEERHHSSASSRASSPNRRSHQIIDIYRRLLPESPSTGQSSRK
eukprot:TRINITY_DN24797_c0_g1_i1.p1 TRINITY_DN24797_c0_g1~~TRINITY_DN24797_c0_g1_i1.p1  ORF type:complete len:183 (-),score=31.46 TRINITY_DN24797_c0_g1_i1:44-592(-)